MSDMPKGSVGRGKPKEWKLRFKDTYSGSFEKPSFIQDGPTEFLDDTVIHVVEYDALVAALAEIEQLKVERVQIDKWMSSGRYQIELDAIALEKERDELKAELERANADHIQACQLVADMHAAAVGGVMGPKRGVIEDVQDLRDELKRTVHQWQQASIEWGKEKHMLKAELEQAKSDDAKTQAALEYVRGLLDEKTLELERAKAAIHLFKQSASMSGRIDAEILLGKELDDCKVKYMNKYDELTEARDELEQAKENENIKLTHIENLELEVCRLKTELEQAKAESSKWQNAAKDQDDYCDTVEQELEQAKEDLKIYEEAYGNPPHKPNNYQLKSLNADLQMENRKLKADLKAVNELTEGDVDVVHEIARLKWELDWANNQLSELEKADEENLKLGNTLKIAVAGLHNREARVRTLEQQLDRANEKAAYSSSLLKRETAAHLTTLDLMNSKNLALTQELERANETIIWIRDELCEWNDELNKADAEVERLTLTTESLSAKCAKFAELADDAIGELESLVHTESDPWGNIEDSVIQLKHARAALEQGEKD